LKRLLLPDAQTVVQCVLLILVRQVVPTVTEGVQAQAQGHVPWVFVLGSLLRVVILRFLGRALYGR